MGASKHVVVFLMVAWAGLALAGQEQAVPRSQTGPGASPVGRSGPDTEAVNLGGQRSELARKVQVLELDLAGIDARRKALQEQIAAIRDEASKQVGEDVVTQEIQRLLGANEQNLARVRKAVEAGLAPAADLAQAQEGLAKARIELARRREELTRLAGGGPLEEFTKESIRLAVDKAEKEAQLQVVHRQLEETQKQLARVAPVPPRTDADAVNLGGQRSELTRRAQALELDLAGLDARQKALQERVAVIRDEAGRGLSEDVVTQELQKLLATTEQTLVRVKQAAEAGRASLAELNQAQESVAKARIELARRREEMTKQVGGGQLAEFTKEMSRLTIDRTGKEAQLQTVRRQLEDVQKQLSQVTPPAQRSDAEAVNLNGQRSELTRRVQALELDLAGLDARRKALQEQVAVIRDQASKGVSEDVVTQELQKLLGASEENLANTRKLVETGRAAAVDLTRAQEALARARIELARRREELTRQAGGGQLEEFTKEMGRLGIDQAEKEAQQQVVHRQLEEVQRQLSRVLTSDSKVGG